MWPTPTGRKFTRRARPPVGATIQRGLAARSLFLVTKGFHASPLGEQIQASAYIVNRDGSLRLLNPKLGDALEVAWGSAPLPGASCAAG